MTSPTQAGSAAAPSGAVFCGPLEQPAISLGAQGPAKKINSSPTAISRMLRGVFQHEKQIRAWEDMSKSDGKRFAKDTDGKLRWLKVKDLVGDSLVKARRSRDKHIADIKHAIDYALTTDAYTDSQCSECKTNVPAITCGSCGGRGVVRVKRTSKRAVQQFRRVTYFNKVLDDTVRCAKIRYGTSEANQAYAELEDANRGLIHKFGSEKQTSLEGEDAAQGARHGLVDAAMRFDPTRKSMAVFSTVAYTWCFRNSRARQDGAKRAGVYAPSIEDMGGKNGERNNAAALVTSAEGALGTFTPACGTDPSLILDLREKLQELPTNTRAIIEGQLVGKSVAQLSEQLGLTCVKVRKLKAAAFAYLRTALSGYVEAISD